MSATETRAQPAATVRAVPQSHGARSRKVLVYVLLSTGLLAMAAPFLWMALSAFKTPQQLGASPPVWIPTEWTDRKSVV